MDLLLASLLLAQATALPPLITCADLLRLCPSPEDGGKAIYCPTAVYAEKLVGARFVGTCNAKAYYFPSLDGIDAPCTFWGKGASIFVETCPWEWHPGCVDVRYRCARSLPKPQEAETIWPLYTVPAVGLLLLFSALAWTFRRRIRLCCQRTPNHNPGIPLNPLVPQPIPPGGMIFIAPPLIPNPPQPQPFNAPLPANPQPPQPVNLPIPANLPLPINPQPANLPLPQPVDGVPVAPPLPVNLLPIARARQGLPNPPLAQALAAAGVLLNPILPPPMAQPQRRRGAIPQPVFHMRLRNRQNPGGGGQ